MPPSDGADAPVDPLGAGGPTTSQTAFAAALLTPGAAPPEGVVDPDGRPAPKRFNVYRNNVLVSLADSLASAYPMAARLVGEAFFRQVALAYARGRPPTSPLMTDYGVDFADFVAALPSDKRPPWLADVCRIDRAWLEAYHSADADPAPPESLGAIPPDQLADARLSVHPAARILALGTPGLSIWRHAQAQSNDKLRLPSGGEDALIVRPQMIVEVHALPPGGAAFAQALAQGATLGDAAAVGAGAVDAFDLSAQLTILLQSGALTAVSV